MIRILTTAAVFAGAVAFAPVAAAGPYDSCSDARADGHSNIPSDSPYYWSGGDRDGDGIACEG